ncbi:MAG: ATP-binding protein [Spirochaetota bacterium]
MTFLMSSSGPIPASASVAAPSVVGFAVLIREAMVRLSADGWKRHASWLLGEFGRLFDVPGVFLFRNYPEAGVGPTGVRLYSWRNPVCPPAAGTIDYRVISWDAAPFDRLRSRLEAGESTYLPMEPAVLLVPVHAGGEWWGVLGVYPGAGEAVAGEAPVPDGAHRQPTVAEPARLLAEIIGDSVLDGSVRQALRWSERLHRIQRDIAVAAGNASSTDESLSELLDLVCEFGEFSAAAVDVVHDEGTERIARHGEVPDGVSGAWCDACTHRIGSATAWREPRYFESGELEHSGPCSLGDLGFHAIAVVPLKIEGRMQGAMSLFSRRRSHVPVTVQRSLEAVASGMATLLERIRSERAVRTMAERYQLAARAGRIGVWEYHPRRRRFLVDAATLDILGTTASFGASGTIDADAMMATFHEDDRAAFGDWLAGEADREQDGFERECRLRTDEGHDRWVVIRGSRRPDFDGEHRVVGTVLDVTTTKTIQSQLRQAHREADEQSRAKGTFMARMSHEFRTPLNAILGYVQMLRESETSLRSEAVGSLDHIEQSARHLLAMVENILDQNRLETGRLAIHPEPVDLDELLDPVAKTGRILARERGLEFAFRAESELPSRVELDAGRVRQALLNLVSNAVKYTGSGTVTLRARWSAGRLRLAVVDTGPGIPPEDRGRVFLPFRRRDDDRRPGSGLGLSISQELVQLMGSRIWLASVIGTGSAFWFTIEAPMVPTSQRPDDAVGAAHPAGSSDAQDAAPAAARELPTELLDELRRLARIGDLAGVGERARQALSREWRENAFLLAVEARAAAFHVGALRALLDETGARPDD